MYSAQLQDIRLGFPGCDFGAQFRKYVSRENIWKELVVSEICCMAVPFPGHSLHAGTDWTPPLQFDGAIASNDFEFLAISLLEDLPNGLPVLTV